MEIKGNDATATGSISPSPHEIQTRRRDFHKHAEQGWCEVRTASLIARELTSFGFEVKVGRQVLVEKRMGLPGRLELEEAYDRALATGADPEFAAKVADGFTGVVGIVRGGRPGPRVALRFDIDANYGHESRESSYLPEREGFVSATPGVHHSCGHDAHAAIGLAVAQTLSNLPKDITGEIRLIFQPAEEGLRGGPAMVAAGAVDDIDLVIGCHIGVQATTTGSVVAGYDKILASGKFDVTFQGKNAHAGISPHEGRDAIRAASIAVQGLLSINRHGDGETRINVGTIRGGETRNSIPATAHIQAEIRADDSSILDYLKSQVDAVVAGAATICEVTAAIEYVGGADGASSDRELAAVIAKVAEDLPAVDQVIKSAEFKASDDMSSFMLAVQNAGGKAVYFGLGSDLTDVHHAPRFNIDDAALPIGHDIFIGALRQVGALQ